MWELTVKFAINPNYDMHTVAWWLPNKQLCACCSETLSVSHSGTLHSATTRHLPDRQSFWHIYCCTAASFSPINNGGNNFTFYSISGRVTGRAKRDLVTLVPGLLAFLRHSVRFRHSWEVSPGDTPPGMYLSP